ncbi:MFS transporter, partial [Escherichia coli]|nr:MFS transporter [Escherichia coli]
PDRPADARWLTPEQQSGLEQAIQSEQAAVVSHKTSWVAAFADMHIWLLAVFWLLQAFGTIGLTLFMPLIVKDLSGSNNLIVSLLSAVPFVAACIFMFLNG